MRVGRHFVLLLSLSLAASLSLAGFAAASLGALSPAPVAGASSTSSAVHRNVVWYGVPQAAPRNLHIESTSVDTPVQDEFQITYGAGNFTLVYQRTASGPIATQFTMTPSALMEWNDTSGDGQFEDGVPVVAYTPLGPNAFGRWPIQHNETTMPGGVHINSFLIQSNKGDLTLNLTIADGFVQLPSGQNLTPMEAKLTFEVNHAMVQPDTRLSLRIAISTNQRVALNNQSWDDQYEFSSDDRAINVTSDAGANASSAFFAWSNMASVNGVRGRVIPAGPFVNETAGAYDLYLTYPRQPSGELNVSIVHDPTIGVVSAAYLSGLLPGPVFPYQGDAVLYAVSLAGIAALVAGTAILVRRRRRAGP